MRCCVFSVFHSSLISDQIGDARSCSGAPLWCCVCPFPVPSSLPPLPSLHTHTHAHTLHLVSPFGARIDPPSPFLSSSSKQQEEEQEKPARREKEITLLFLSLLFFLSALFAFAHLVSLCLLSLTLTFSLLSPLFCLLYCSLSRTTHHTTKSLCSVSPSLLASLRALLSLTRAALSPG